MNGLLLLFGEAFREGKTQTRKRDSKKSILPQKNACESHTRFCKYLKDVHAISMDVLIDTYDTIHESKLKSWYSNPLTYKSNKNLMGLKIVQDAVNAINKNYDFIFITRVDIFIKPYFYKIFNPNWNKLLFLCQEWKSFNCGLYKDTVTYPLVNTMFEFIPKSYFKVLNNVTVEHCAWQHYMKIFNLTALDMGYMIKDKHSGNTQLDFNPYYRIVGRPEHKIHHDKSKSNISDYGKTKKIKCKESKSKLLYITKDDKIVSV
jgi:hypothetical protein